MKRNPHAGDLYVFRGCRRGDLVKVLWHDGIGLSLVCEAHGPQQIYLAVGFGRRGVDLGGADGLYGRQRFCCAAIWHAR